MTAGDGAGRELVGGYACAGCGTGRSPWCDTFGSHSSDRGRYQFHLPSSFIDAGSRTARTIVASIRIATARPTPICLKSSALSVAKIANTATITIAALVTVPAVALIP